MDSTLNLVPKRPGSFAKGRTAGLESGLQNQSVLRLGAAAMKTGSTLERLDDVAGYVSNQELGHIVMISHDIIMR